MPVEAVGVIGGGGAHVRDITVITYDSAAMPARALDGFGLLIVDEVHHLPAPAIGGSSARWPRPIASA